MRIELRLFQSHLGSDIAKPHLAKIAVQSAGVPTNRLAIKIAAARQEYVEKPIAIVIDQPNTPTKCFEDGIMPRFFAVSIGKVDSGSGGNVFKDRCSQVGVGDVRLVVVANRGLAARGTC